MSHESAYYSVQVGSSLDYMKKFNEEIIDAAVLLHRAHAYRRGNPYENCALGYLAVRVLVCAAMTSKARTGTRSSDRFSTCDVPLQ